MNWNQICNCSQYKCRIFNDCAHCMVCDALERWYPSDPQTNINDLSIYDQFPNLTKVLEQHQEEEIEHLVFNNKERVLLKRPIFNTVLDVNKVKERVRQLAAKHGEEAAIAFWIKIWKKNSY